MGSTPVGISASRSSAILGLSQYQTPFDVWSQIIEERNPGTLARLGITPSEKPDNAAIRWGTAFEDSIVSLAEQARGQKIHSREALHIVPDVGFPISCHIDGRFADGPLHEGKTTSLYTFRDAWGEPGTDHIPRIYQTQVQHQMLCTCLSGKSINVTDMSASQLRDYLDSNVCSEEAIVSVLVFPRRPEEWEEMGILVEELKCTQDPIMRWQICKDDHVISICHSWAGALSTMGFFHQYRVSADVELQADLVARYTKFWESYVLPETPPPAETWSDILRLWPEPRGTVVATEEQERLAAAYAQINEESSASKKSQEAIKVQLMAAIERGAERPIDSDSTEAIVLRSRSGKKIASLSKQSNGKIVFRCNG